MKALTFNISIAALKQKVWDTMLNAETYQEWTNAAWPGSRYSGQWAPGANIRFIGSDEGAGTLAKILAFEPYDTITAEHIAVILPGGVEDRESEMAKNWVGSTEQYDFREKDGVTELLVSMSVNPEWEAMFNHDWPLALAELKTLCEKA